MERVGKNLKRIRTAKNLSLEQLSYMTELSINQISRIERFEINTSISTLYELSLALDIEITELVKK